ncbi:MAG: YibE/F family protein, partial [Saccharothrix sp.]|nr:YibE/F family protein [Saccharothrix sp.]
VRTLVGSIGLVAAIPITTALAAFVAGREDVPAPTRTAAAPDDRDDRTDHGDRTDRPAVDPLWRRHVRGDLRTGYDPAKGPWRRPAVTAPAAPAPTRARRGRTGRGGSDD